jgi:hypothetical protein
MLGHANHRSGGMYAHTRANVGCRTGKRGFDDVRLADEYQLEGGIDSEGVQRAGYAFRRAAVTTHHIDGD